MKIIADAIRAEREFGAVLTVTEEQFAAARPLPLLVNGLGGGAQAAFLAAYLQEQAKAGRTAVVLTADDATAARAAATLSAAGLRAAAYPTRDYVLHHITASHGIERERLFVLHALLSGGLDAVVTTAAAAMQATMPRKRLGELSLSLSVGGSYAPVSLCERLLALGYARVEAVDGAGQFAVRGGIFDVWAAGESAPVRCEFFGDEIDRMGHFDPISQRFTGGIDTLSLLPAKEVTVDAAARERIRRTVERLAERAGEEGRKTLALEKNAIDAGLDLPFADKYIPIVYERPENLFDYLPERPVAVLLGTSGVREGFAAARSLFIASATSLLEAGVFPRESGELYGSEDGLEARLAASVTLHLNAFSGISGIPRAAGLFGFRSRTGVSYADRADLLREDARRYLDEGYRTLLVCATRAEEEAVSARLREDGFALASLSASETAFALPERGVLYTHTLVEGEQFAGGFDLPSARVAILSLVPEEEKLRQAKRTVRRKRAPAGERLLSYADLREGDFVVHAVHGIGRFDGMTSLTVDGATRDYITIRYAGTDKLFLPADRLEMITKYIGATGADGTPKLSRMGGAEWGRATGRAKQAARDMAKELIALYAARMRRPGHAFAPDDAMQAEFEAAFPYEETDGQIAACEEIKRDMESPAPMDRLLCGDVGYGKTEVALRAAFKAVSDGKQVAILVPTTILAMQHYETALARLRGFPVTVEMLSRFRTPKQAAAILRRLSRGEIDILIGTHKLLSKKIEFRDLGLLVVDEEQRLGVAQKEKLKEMAGNVDVLTLTATPIPRTLNMAMSGIRDMSLLDEAPGERHPVETYVMEHDDLVIAEAIRRELRRGGQVIYLYNRVDTMDRVLAKLTHALPEARIMAAHGKTDREELEDIWQALVRGELDVILCTTIVETGVDLPNANTLIIEDADRLGLSQLHQIRGRVGRSGRQAYAYFTYRAGKALSEVATKRLSAIREYAAFGAGFKIALRDLEIRGAGNLLGAEQHGHIEAVGYELYIRLLNDAVLEEKGVKKEALPETQIDIRADAHIPEGYVAGAPARMELYKKISAIRDGADAEDIREECRDRYGRLPRAVERLLQVALARALASRLGLVRVEHSGNELRFLLTEVDLASWSVLFAERKDLSFRKSAPPAVICRLAAGDDPCERAAALLSRLWEVKSENEEKQE
ncbi:MAG: transcription-repair coupling factor [Clostridia bacterium]|nr:transcription-repair coupling factor [Clostridia bacterium]